MIRSIIVAAALAVSVQAAVPQNLDVIKERKQTMKDNGAAAGATAKMLKGDAPFDLATVQKSLNTFISASKKMPSLFPDDSKTGGDTRALPAVWADKADVDARFAKFGQDATDALAAIKDEASFKASFPPIFKDCGGCHEKYRAAQN
ncbi:cytochrome c [Methylocapsa sp. S129]|uniref:c-type cytochrome n=1 Tax=Methylocapsa sp. S129 TaxID=1641869 RepID=UPI00131CE2C1|nr:cytochrome c [Methylocapsa sp. S129]